MICDIYLFSNEYYINLLIPEFLYLPAQIYHSVFISQLHLILISTICVLKAINDNLLLLNFIHNDFVTFKKLFNMFQEIISISELNLLILLLPLFFWIYQVSSIVYFQFSIRKSF